MGLKPVDFSRLKTYAIQERRSLVDATILAPVPAVQDSFQGAHSLLEESAVADAVERLAEAICAAHDAGRSVALGMGAHAIKLGLGPYIADLIDRRVITSVAMNGATAFHDLELAIYGVTSEDVGEALPAGRFGFAEESVRDYNAAAVRGHEQSTGLGEELAKTICDRAPLDRQRYSVMAACARAAAPVTVHLSIGCDVTHMHPSADGAALGATTHHDFRVFCAVVASLSGGVFLNMGSAVVMPEVFLKAVSVAINLGASLDGLVTGNLDMIKHYRPSENVLRRIPGDGIDIRARHERSLPALHACVVHRLSRGA